MKLSRDSNKNSTSLFRNIASVGLVVEGCELKFLLYERSSGSLESTFDDLHAFEDLLFLEAFADDLDGKRQAVHCR